MNTTTLLDLLRSRGITLFVEGDRLRYRGPAGALTDDLRQAVAQNREGLLASLRRGTCPQCRRPLDEKRRCWRCGFRTCAVCGKDTGSPFVATCAPCGHLANGNRGDAL